MPEPASTPPPEPLILSQEEKTWGMLSHLLAFLGYVVGLGQIVAPLVVYFMYRDKSRFVAFHALQSLYFQIALLVVALLGVVAIFATCGVGVLIVAPALVVIGVGSVIYMIVAAIKASAGEWFEYWLVGEWARRQLGM